MEPAFTAAGPLIVAPLPGGSTDGGLLVCLRRKDSPKFGAEHLPLLAGLAEQASLALEVSDRQEERRRYELVAERERIARDLHDHVIQRLFAVGLSLQSQESRVSDRILRERLANAVQQVDEAIRDLRTSIFDLRAATGDRPRNLRRRLLDIAAGTGDGGLTSSVRIDGPVDTLVPPELAEHAEAVVREAVSNAVRHSGGSTVTVAIAVGDRLSIEVTDDGTGIADDTPRRGLRNLADRARGCGGEFSVQPGPEGGTRLRWTAPLPEE
jgi:signal transduction histidine kinase